MVSEMKNCATDGSFEKSTAVATIKNETNGKVYHTTLAHSKLTYHIFATLNKNSHNIQTILTKIKKGRVFRKWTVVVWKFFWRSLKKFRLEQISRYFLAI